MQGLAAPSGEFDVKARSLLLLLLNPRDRPTSLPSHSTFGSHINRSPPSPSYPPCRRNDALVTELSVPKEGAQPTKLASQYAQPFSIQFVELMKRCMREYWRNPGVRRGAGNGERCGTGQKGMGGCREEGQDGMGEEGEAGLEAGETSGRW